MKPTTHIETILRQLPQEPGVYQYFDASGSVIYVGKAKNLKRRVNSYFNREHQVYRTSVLVKYIWDMQYTVVNTEEEALDLENSLIKEFQPHYNVLLKDDKSYPWICVTKELYPRVFITRDKLSITGLTLKPKWPRLLLTLCEKSFLCAHANTMFHVKQ